VIKYLNLTNILKIIVFLVFTALSVRAVNLNDMVINEIAWMGTSNSANDEWVELYNNTNQTINLEGWTLIAEDGSPQVVLMGQIPAFSFYLLERTDDSTVPGIKADLIYGGALNNKGEGLKLFNNQNILIDEVNCNNGWFFGDNSTKETMERKNALLQSGLDNWQTSKNPGGTPRLQNSKSPEIGSLETEKEEIGKGFGIDSQKNINYPSGIIFNEILPSPDGPDAENEWIEIYNRNNSSIDLSDWKISDSIGSIKTYIFPKGTEISGLSFLVLDRTKTKITLNNDKDRLVLIQPNDKIIDEVVYEKAPQGKSYALKNSKWNWDDNPTPGKINNIKLQKPEEKALKEIKNDNGPLVLSKKNEKEFEASLIKAFKKPASSNIFLLALGTAILSGILMLMIKKKLTFL
jgi:hypothetical protein